MLEMRNTGSRNRKTIIPYTENERIPIEKKLVFNIKKL